MSISKQLRDRAAEGPDDHTNLERIADALERLVIAADSIATALSLQTLAQVAYETGASRGRTGEEHEHRYKGTGGPCTICGQGIYIERAERLAHHEFQPNPDLAYFCRICGGELGDDCHITGAPQPRQPLNFSEHLDRSIEEMTLSIRTYNCLKAAKISTFRQLAEKTEEEILVIPGVGRVVINEIKNALKGEGLTLSERPPDGH
jgi:hypothetical protein